jgi:ParB/RepB/Spo0J family partition protein
MVKVGSGHSNHRLNNETRREVFRNMSSEKKKLEFIPLKQVRENTNALRTEVDKDDISYKELVMSIRDEGVLMAILVREEQDELGNIVYPLVDGLQRFTAASEVGLDVIPAQITTMSESKVLAAQVMANATRVETAPAQYAKALKKILQLEPTLTSDDLGRRVGKSRGWIESQLKLTKLTSGIQKLIDEGKLTVSNGVSLASLPQDKQEEYLTSAMSESPATFGPKITEVVKEIRSAARQGRVVDNSFKAVPTPRKSSVVKTIYSEIESGNLTTIQGLIQANSITDPFEAAAFMLKWFMSMDPTSVAQQRAKWESEQLAKEAAKKEREDAKAKEKLAKAQAETQKVAA